MTYEYNRLGRQSKVIQTKAAPNGWTHTTTFNLNQYLELESEAITGDIYARTITRNHQSSGTGLLPGRDAGFSIGNEYSVEYDYDEYGRLNYISGDSLGLPGGAVIYEYVPNSNLVNAVNYLDAGANDLAWTIRTYGTSTDHRDLLTSVENHNGSTVMSKYAYQYDNAGRRTAVLTTGEAFINSAYNIWGYNDRSELQASNRYNGNQIVIPPDSQTEVTGERRLYHYDPIGNRKDYTFGTGSPLYYCPNGLNQYDSTGVQQSCPQGNPSESFSYDHDGNMTADGTLTYEWDGENRLTAVYPINPASTSKKCTFTYDFMSRRIRKQVYTRNSGNTAWNTTPSEDWRFVYDQWNVVLVLDGRDGPDEGTAPDNVTIRKYTWGLDLSGLTGIASSAGIHGAGGIGGLLAAVETGGEDDYVYWYLYDGNGNVGQVLDATDTENIITAALYEYDPYGNLIVADGYYALNNPFRFSTKWFDTETELYYYGYRYYSPRLGRWINRDPLGEEGGLNLYSLVSNQPIGQIDILGTWGRDVHYTKTCEWAKSMMSDKCAEAFAAADEETDDYFNMTKNSSPMYLIGDYRYHFDTTADGLSGLPNARLERLAFEENEADKFFQRPQSEYVRKGIERLGRGLHAAQDVYSHSIEHNASTPFDHAPRLHCTAMLDPYGTRIPACIAARTRQPKPNNWDDVHRPDNATLWSTDVDTTGERTKLLMNGWMNRWNSLECVCRR